MAINLNQFTVPNGAITDLKELMFEALYNDPDIERILTTKKGVENRKKFGYLYNLGDLGLAGGGCDPTYTDLDITGNEKTWDLGEWTIDKKICYKRIENTIAEYCINKGTNAADLTATEFVTEILTPMLENALLDMFYRVAFFGDKQAKNIADSGNITTGVNVKLFTMCDGIFKRLRTITAANSNQLTPIAANTATETVSSTEKVTKKAQMSAIRGEGVAIGIVDELLQNADSRIFDLPGHAIYMTSSLFKALRNDVHRVYKMSLSIENIKAGINLSSYDGVPIIALDIWDRMIRKFEDNGTAFNAPHRAVFSAPVNLAVGTNDIKAIPDLSIIFDGVSRNNYIHAQSMIDANVVVDELVQIAM